MHRRVVEGIAAVHHPQKACRLLERLGAEAGYLQQCLALAKGTVLVAKLYDVLRQRWT